MVTEPERSVRGPLLLLVVWLAGVVVATSVGVLAVRLVAEQVGDPAVPPLSASAAAAAPTPGRSATGPAGSTAPSVTADPSRPAAAGTAAFRSPGGTVGLQCTGTTAQLLYATPADGYALDERSVSGSGVEVRFEGRGTRVRMELSCADGTPRLVDVRTDDRSGGDD
ncbi:MAG: hypothetical protein JWN08_2486 [Frankiales bacterium]|nr:hypothetical protein [Frankiales bacterium]